MQYISRFLCSASILAVTGALFAQSISAQSLKNKSGAPIHIGLQLYSVREDCVKDLPGVLKAVSKMGYTGVEFAGYYGRSAEELRRMLEDNSLKCYGTHIDLEALLGDNLEKTVEFNRVLGNKLLVVPWIAEERRNSKKKLIETTKLFSEIARKIEPQGMILGYHNHTDEFKPVEGELPWYTFFANADRRVIIQFDIGNALAGGAQAAPFLAKYPGRVLSVHLKDHSTSNLKALLGEGDERWDEVLPLLKGKAGTKWFIVEQGPGPYPSLENAEKCLRNFEKMWKGR
jgi:sugar phosphate isomerase/epimerase